MSHIQSHIPKIASKIEWLQDRPDKFKETEKGKEALNGLVSLYLRNDKNDPLTPWLWREAKKGRIEINPFGAIFIDRGARVYGPEVVSHWADWFASNSPTRRGVDIMSLRFPDFIERINEWDQELQSQQAEKDADNGRVIFNLPNGWTIRELAPDDLDYEGAQMGHCVGGASYENAVRDEEIRIISLRDEENVPHATMELQGHLSGSYPHNVTWVIEQVQGKGNTIPKPEYQAMIKDWVQSLPANERPVWKDPDEPIYDIHDLMAGGEADPDMGGYEPHGDYGVPVPERGADYEYLLQDIHEKGGGWGRGYSRYDPDHGEAIYEYAKKRGEIPQLGSAFNDYSEQAQNAIMHAEDQNMDWLQYPGEYEDQPEFWEKMAEEKGTPGEGRAVYEDALHDYEYNRSELMENVPQYQAQNHLADLLMPHWNIEKGAWTNERNKSVFSASQPMNVVQLQYPNFDPDHSGYPVIYHLGTDTAFVGQRGGNHAALEDAITQHNPNISTGLGAPTLNWRLGEDGLLDFYDRFAGRRDTHADIKNRALEALGAKGEHVYQRGDTSWYFSSEHEWAFSEPNVTTKFPEGWMDSYKYNETNERGKKRIPFMWTHHDQDPNDVRLYLGHPGSYHDDLAPMHSIDFEDQKVGGYGSIKPRSYWTGDPGNRDEHIEYYTVYDPTAKGSVAQELSRHFVVDSDHFKNEEPYKRNEEDEGFWDYDEDRGPVFGHVNVVEQGKPDDAGIDFHGDRRPFLWDGNTKTIYVGPPGATHDSIGVDDDMGDNPNEAYGGIYPDGTFEIYAGEITRDEAKEAAAALGLDKVVFGEWHVGEEPTNRNKWTFGSTEWSEPEWPDPLNFLRRNRALELTNGTWHQWDKPQAHAEYMLENGITPEQVKTYAHYNPDSGWFDYNYLRDDYNDIYNSLKAEGYGGYSQQQKFADSEDDLSWLPSVLFHWTEARLAPMIDSEGLNLAGVYLTTADDPAGEWNPDVPNMIHPLRVAVDTAQLDPDLFGVDEDTGEGYAGPAHRTLEASGNLYYKGSIPRSAILALDKFDAPEDWHTEDMNPEALGYAPV